MNSGTTSLFKLLAAAVIAGLVGWMLVAEYRRMGGHSDRDTKVWFYDESQKKLYAMPVSTVPPDKGIGGPTADGYRAIVVGFAGYKHDKSKRKIAYLEKYSDELKKSMEELKQARAEGRLFSGTMPSRSSEYFQGNTLVKREGEAEWHPANSDEGKRIMNEWRSWRGVDGGGAVVCAVD